MRIVKFGGSILETASDVMNIVSNTGKDTVIIPGGGIFADMIRSFDESKHISAETAHKMAIYAMNQYGLYLHDISGMNCSSKLLEESFILLPYEVLLKYDVFPYSWDITSDSLSCFIAKLYKVNNITLLKHVRGIQRDGKTVKNISALEVASMQQEVVDKFLCQYLLKYKIDCYIYDVTDIQRFQNNYSQNIYDTKITCE